MKPSPEIITRALVLLDVPAAAAVFVGDSITDVQAGHDVDTPPAYR